MNVWLLHVGEELPGDPNPRLFRYGRLANELVERGHSVLRWAPTFQHFRKQQRYECDKRVSVNDRYEIQFLRAPGYRTNVSLSRLRMYRTLAARFDQLTQQEARPDVIVAGLPSLEWCASAIEYGRRHGVSVVLDIRDLWPDIYANLLPLSLRRTALWAMGPVRRRAGRLFAAADSLTAVSQSYLDWSLDLAGRSERTEDRVVPLGYERAALSSDEENRLVGELEAAGVDRRRKLACFSGLLEKSYDIAALAEAARRLEADRPGEYQIVVAGNGSKAAELRQAAATTPALVTLGWVEPVKIAALLQISDVGLAAYAKGALQSLPNKTFEYLSAGLPIVSSLSGEFSELMAEHALGEEYAPGDGAGMAAAIRRVMDDAQRLAGTRTRATELFNSRFTASQVHADFADHLESLVAQPAARAVA